jgi:hypothetical protein
MNVPFQCWVTNNAFKQRQVSDKPGKANTDSE